MYDGTEPRRVLIVACNYDHLYALLEADREVGIDDRQEGEDEYKPRPMGPDGCLYYVKGTSSPGHSTLAEARRWVDSQPWAPVVWDL